MNRSRFPRRAIRASAPFCVVIFVAAALLQAQEPEKLEGVVTSSEAATDAKADAKGAAGAPQGFAPIDFEETEPAARQDVAVVLGPGAAVREDDARSGRRYLEIEGVNQPDQQGLLINDVAVAPNSLYHLSFYFRTTEPLNGRLSLLVSQVSDSGAVVAQKKYYPNGKNYTATKNLTHAWTRYETDVVTAPAASRLSIGLTTLFMLPPNKVGVDDVRFEQRDACLLLKWEIDPKTGILSGELTPGHAVRDQVECYVPFILKDGHVVEQQQLAADATKFQFDLSSFSDGVPYYISAYATLKDGNRVFQTVSDSSDVAFGRRRFDVRFGQRCDVPLELTDKDNLFYTYQKERPWEGNRIGELSDDAPPPAPWTPLCYDAASASVKNWNNTFAAGPGLGGIDIAWQSPDVHMTREPLAISLNGVELSKILGHSKVDLSKQTPNKVVLASSGAMDGARLETQMAIEFDGFVRHTLRLVADPGKTYKVDNLAVRMRFSPGFVRHHLTGIEWNRYSAAPTFEISDFRPRLWFGNFETGIEWCIERYYPPVLRQQRPWAVLTQEDGGAVLTLHLVNATTEVAPDRPLVVEFGLLPTPCKPSNPRMRGVRMLATHQIVGGDVGSPFKYYGFPEVTSPEDFDAMAGPARAAHTNLLYYFAAGWAMETVPQMTYFKKEWLTRPAPRYTSNNFAYLPFATGDTATVRWTPSWLDLCLFKFREFVEATGVRGAYWDTAYPRIDSDERGVYYPVFTGREFHKRAFVFLREKYGDDAMLLAHISGENSLPYTAFSDIVLTGEQYRMPLMQHAHYLDFATLDEMRATFAGNWGPARMFLPQYWQAEKSEDRALMTQVGGFALSFDSLVLSPSDDGAKGALADMLRRQQALGDLTRAVWHPYWKPNSYVRASNAHLWLSLYQINDDLLLTVFNPTNAAQEATLDFGGYRTTTGHGGTATIYDPVADREQAMAAMDAGTRVSLPPFGALLITVRSAPAARKGNP